jgi:hypothetical protein
MGYQLFESGVTGPSANIGGSSEYHIDSKFSTKLGEDEARRRFEAKVRKYRELGRNVEFSNEGVGGLVYDLDADEDSRRDLFRKAYGAHAPRDGWYSLDYYAPKQGHDRFHESAEGAPIFAVAGPDGRRETGTGGNYGFHSLIYDKDGSLISKVGHGDDRFPVTSGPMGDPSTPSPVADKTAPPATTDYSQMSASQMNQAYDKLRMAGDIFKAEDEGLKMHKAFHKR